MVDITISLVPNLILFVLGLWGLILNRKNLILMLLSLELILLSVNLMFLIYEVLLDDIEGQYFAFYVLTIAAAEAAIGLALLVAFYRLRGTIAVKFMNLMKG
jgi:NADH-quinone oxidoreductase subunit K